MFVFCMLLLVLAYVMNHIKLLFWDEVRIVCSLATIIIHIYLLMFIHPDNIHGSHLS